MDGTARFSNVPRHALPLSGVARAAVASTSLALLGWAFVALLGWSGLTGILAGATVLAWSAWSTRGWAARAEQRAVTSALREHVDPGPELRESVTATARRQLAAPAVDRWGPSVVLATVAAACVVSALVRHDVRTALPAVPLAVLALVLVGLVRRANLLAYRWVTERPAAPDRSA
jgi:hypothetical protein